MFSQSAEYALRAVLLLAESGQRKGGRQIAEELDVPANYLSKILMQLCRQGVLDSQKGWGGGFELAKKPGEIRIGAVVGPFEGSETPRDCILGSDRCGDDDPCALHSYWKQIKTIYEMMTERITVADLVRPTARR
ncbi:MAG: HTH-type transcriptional regulator IscR [Phycisphaerae bacterium]|nr:HTH-type transcriptional regulator IscR [Phycisphaerae bacterium]